MSTTENVDLKLFSQKRNSHYPSAPVLFRSGTSMQKNIPSWNIFQLNVSISLCNLLSMPVGKKTRNQTQVFVAETKKLLANSSYGYQLMDRSRHTVTKNLSDDKTHDAINSKSFKRFDYINDQLYEVELAKAEFEHRGPITVGFLILQYAKLRMLELYYRF